MRTAPRTNRTAAALAVPLATLAITLVAGGCSRDDSPAAPAAPAATPADTAAPHARNAAPAGAGGPGVARAELKPTAGNRVSGEVTFTRVPEGGVRVHAKIAGLLGELHGFHIHEHGDCSAADASSAGGHFAPTPSRHGGPLDEPGKRHVGDLGNLAANPSTGNAVYDRVDPLLTLSGPTSIVGRSVVVHAGEDDFASQPAGNAGPRVACGVIVAGEKP